MEYVWELKGMVQTNPTNALIEFNLSVLKIELKSGPTTSENRPTSYYQGK